MVAPQRMAVLRTRGLLVDRVSRPCWPDAAQFRWLTAAPDVTRGDLTWYIDGSVMDPTVESLGAAAAAVVVVNDEGDLISFGEAALPGTVQTSAGAEAHALLIAIGLCPEPPRVVTDCMGLLDLARGGSTRATLPTRLTAGIWTHIVTAVDGAPQVLVDQRRLVWMPSHVAAGSRAAVLKSDGSQITDADWRANRLCDLIAKRCARRIAMPRGHARRLQALGELAVVQAAALGAVTRAANCCWAETVNAAGDAVRVAQRDAVTVPPRPLGQPKRPWRKRLPAPPPPPRPVSMAVACSSLEVEPRPRTAASLDAFAAAAERRRVGAAVAGFLVRQALAERHAGAASSLADPYAVREELLARVRARVRAHAAAAAAAASSASAPVPL
jgi:hypothetical protein